MRRYLVHFRSWFIGLEASLDVGSRSGKLDYFNLYFFLLYRYTGFFTYHLTSINNIPQSVPILWAESVDVITDYLIVKVLLALWDLSLDGANSGVKAFSCQLLAFSWASLRPA